MVIDQYHFKLPPEKYTIPIAWLPRWLRINSTPDLFDHVDIPPVGSLPPTDPYSFPYSPIEGAIFTPWVLVDSTPSTGAVLPSLAELAIYETSLLEMVLHTEAEGGFTGIGAATPEFAWVVEAPHGKSITDVRIAVGDTSMEGEDYIAVPQAKSPVELFWSGSYRWMQDDNVILLYGLDLLPSSTVTRPGSGNWQFIPYHNHWDGISVVFVEHPESKRWIPVHPVRIREDYLIPFYTGTSLRIRTRRPDAPNNIGFVNVVMDGLKGKARKVNIWCGADEVGLMMGATRRPGERGMDFVRRLWGGYRFGGGVSKEDIQTQLVSIFGAATVSQVDPDATSWTLAVPNANTVRFSDLPVKLIFNEVPQASGGIAYSRAASGGLSEMWVDGKVLALEKAGPPFPEFAYRLPPFSRSSPSMLFRWVLRTWERAGNTIIFTANKPNIPLYVLEGKDVAVLDPSINTMRRAFVERDPSLRWRSTGILDNVHMTGLAEFS